MGTRARLRHGMIRYGHGDAGTIGVWDDQVWAWGHWHNWGMGQTGALKWTRVQDMENGVNVEWMKISNKLGTH